MLKDCVRSNLRRLLTKEKSIVLERRMPFLERSFEGIEELGVYLHVPFCEQICPYCPYNKEIYHPDLAEKYTQAVKREINFYSDLVNNKPVTSLYIGGGTPTTMLYSGLEEILEHIFKSFNMQCDIHMESHPNHLSSDNLNTIISMGINHLSAGVEALQDRHLKFLNRPYTTKEVKGIIERAASKGFKCVNADFIFALPNQTYNEVEQAGHALVEMGVDQVAAYPLFIFPYTRMGETADGNNYKISSLLKRRKMLAILEKIFYEAGFQRTSVWAFTRPGVPKYCSVTVPLYIGLGASGGSYLKDVFYLNTFHVAEYIHALEEGKMPIALSLDLSENMQMAGWLYWRTYETKFRKEDFKKRFGKDFDKIYGRLVKLLSFLGFLKDDKGQVVLSDKGAYWLHVLEDLFSLDYISKLWGNSKQDPWPTKVVL
jgi:oxygen-independent coproporphyrinogen-3 oxidase